MLNNGLCWTNSSKGEYFIIGSHLRNVAGACNFNEDIKDKDIENVVIMLGMNRNVETFNQYIVLWATSGVVDVSSMF